MLAEADGTNGSYDSPARGLDGSFGEDRDGLSLNGSSARNGVSNATESSRANGTHGGNGTNKKPLYYGHDREEVTRLLMQALGDLGYEDAARVLSRESSYDLESPYASTFRMAILQGDWAEAEAILSRAFVVTEAGNHDTTTDPIPPTEHTIYSAETAPGLALSEYADKNQMLFLIREQKYLELLEIRDLGAALMVLRQELQPLRQDERHLHALSSLIMCQSPDELKYQAGWDGALGESRKRLLSSLSRSISPKAMIPEHRLANILMQFKENQIKNCPYHNSAETPSLFMDHTCERYHFPIELHLSLNRHRNEVWYLAFSHDGSMLATASKDGTVIVYETVNFQVLYTLKDHKDSVAYVCWSPDDSYFVSCSHDKEARLWDTKRGVCIRTLKCHSEPVTTAAWSPDGKSFVTASLDIKAPMVIWDAAAATSDHTETTTPIHNFENNCARVQDCAIAPVVSDEMGNTSDDSSSTPLVRLIAACVDKSIHIFDYNRREKLGQLKLDYDITCVNISQNGLEMLINLSCNELWTMDIERRVVIQKVRGYDQGKFVIRSCFGGATEGFLITGGQDSKVTVWHRHSGQLIEQFPAHMAGCVNAVAWNPAKHTMFASAGDDGEVKVYVTSIFDDAVSLNRLAHAAKFLQCPLEDIYLEIEDAKWLPPTPADQTHTSISQNSLSTMSSIPQESSSTAPPQWGSGNGTAGGRPSALMRR